MDKYKFTQQEAVHQIADQLKYDTYLRAVNNEPIKSYLDDWFIRPQIVFIYLFKLFQFPLDLFGIYSVTHLIHLYISFVCTK